RTSTSAARIASGRLRRCVPFARMLWCAGKLRLSASHNDLFATCSTVLRPSFPKPVDEIFVGLTAFEGNSMPGERGGQFLRRAKDLVDREFPTIVEAASRQGLVGSRDRRIGGGGRRRRASAVGHEDSTAW